MFCKRTLYVFSFYFKAHIEKYSTSIYFKFQTDRNRNKVVIEVKEIPIPEQRCLGSAKSLHAHLLKLA